jgi:hypothetical protein
MAIHLMPLAIAETLSAGTFTFFFQPGTGQAPLTGGIGATNVGFACGTVAEFNGRFDRKRE